MTGTGLWRLTHCRIVVCASTLSRGETPTAAVDSTLETGGRRIRQFAGADQATWRVEGLAEPVCVWVVSMLVSTSTLVPLHLDSARFRLDILRHMFRRQYLRAFEGIVRSAPTLADSPLLGSGYAELGAMPFTLDIHAAKTLPRKSPHGGLQSGGRRRNLISEPAKGFEMMVMARRTAFGFPRPRRRFSSPPMSAKTSGLAAARGSLVS